MRRTISTPPSSSAGRSPRAGRLQLPGAVPRGRTRDDAQMRRAFSHGRHHRQRRRIVGQRDDERARAIDPACWRISELLGVAVQHRHAELVEACPDAQGRLRRRAAECSSRPSASAMCRPTRPHPTMTTWSVSFSRGGRGLLSAVDRAHARRPAIAAAIVQPVRRA